MATESVEPLHNAELTATWSVEPLSKLFDLSLDLDTSYVMTSRMDQHRHRYCSLCSVRPFELLSIRRCAFKCCGGFSPPSNVSIDAFFMMALFQADRLHPTSILNNSRGTLT